MLSDDEIRAALKQAFSIGQTYWQQADSESFAQNRRSDETRAQFDQLVTDTVAALAAAQGEVPSPLRDDAQPSELVRAATGAVSAMIDGLSPVEDGRPHHMVMKYKAALDALRRALAAIETKGGER